MNIRDVRKMTLEILLAKLPAYIHDGDEANRLYFYMGRDIHGNWNTSYETEGRHYFSTTTRSPKESASRLLVRLYEEGELR